MVKQILSILLVALIAFPITATELRGNPEELRNFLHPRQNLVSLHASALITAFADKAIVHLTITTEQKQLADALEANAAIRRDIKQTLIKNGVKASHIHTSQFSSSPQFGWFGTKPKSYQVVNRMSVSIFNEDHLTEIAKLSDASNAIEISSTQFEHTKKEAFIQKVKQKAMTKIMQQKTFYQSKLGVKLKPYRFNESAVSSNASQGARAREQKIMVIGSRIKAKGSMLSKPQLSQPQQSFDEVEYSVSLSVDFILES